MMQSSNNPIHTNNNGINTPVIPVAYVNVSQVESHPQYPPADQVSSHHGYTPPTGHWKDGIFDCFKNCWPSFGCVAFGGSCIQVFYAGQISTKINYVNLQNVFGMFIISTLVLYFIGVIVIISLTANISDPEEKSKRLNSAMADSYIFYYAPEVFILVFVAFLRYKFVQAFNIQEQIWETVLYSIFCAQCSLCQMGRHIYGYTRLFDGDGRFDGSMEYSSLDSNNEQILNFSA